MNNVFFWGIDTVVSFYILFSLLIIFRLIIFRERAALSGEKIWHET